MAEFLSLHDAIARFVKSGDRVALEGFTHLIPFAAAHEIIRQGLTDLTLIRIARAARKLGQYAAQKVGHLQGLHSTCF